MRYNIKAHKIKSGLTRVAGIKNIIAVTAGKGGVGKSTTAVNLAIALAQMGFNTGLLDCDIYGPSIPLLVGAKNYKPDIANNLFIPLNKYGINIMSFGFLVAHEQPTIWRGAIVNKAIQQMLIDSQWGDLDYLIIDLPPGTGDIHLTIAQKLPLTATVVVTTPQDIALLDVVKSIEMFKKLDIPCLGIVENMAVHVCEQCGHKSHVFGHVGLDKLTTKYNYPILISLPLDITITQHNDNGTPIVLENNSIAQSYTQLAKNVHTQLSQLPVDYSNKLSSIKVQQQ